MKGKISSSTSATNNWNLTGHSFCCGIRPSRPSFSAHKNVTLGIEPGHFALGQIQVKFIRDTGIYHRARISSIFAHQTIKKNKFKARIFLVESFDGTDDMLNTLSLFVDTSITEYYELASFTFPLFCREKELGIHSARSPGTGNIVLFLKMTTEAFRISKKKIILLYCLFFLLMSFQ
ncbi:hypothetical protein ES703_116358 [subsurface metagenome]